MLKQLSKKLLLLFAIIVTGYSVVIAQTGPVTGKVSDATDGFTLPGATVVIKGTANGTATDFNGQFSLNVEPNTTVVISYVGYTPQEMVVQPNTTISVSLVPEATGLEEIVVIGYGTTKKEDATGSVAPISSKEFNQGAINTPVNLIAGKVAGVSVISGGGAPGEGVQIRIRGGSSLSASNDPLVVIDGVPVDNEDISGLGSQLSTISPGDIETFTVLKDASATAIYGSRASNGVILITTKKGKIGNPLSINYTGNFSLYTPTRTVDVLDANQFVNEMKSRFPAQVGGPGSLLDTTNLSNTDWQNEIFRNAFGQDHYLSLSGASKNTPYRVSMGFSNQDGILLNDNYQRYTLGFAVGPRLLDDHLSINLNGNGSYVKNKFADRGAIGAAVQFDPTKPVYDAESPYGGYWGWLQANGDPVTQATSNPVALLNLRNDMSNVYRFTGNAQFDYKIHGFEDLRLNLNLGIDYSESDGTVYVPVNSTWSYFNGGEDNFYIQKKSNEVLDFYVNYKKYVESIKSTFDIMAGYSWQHFWRSNYSQNSDVARTPERTEIFDDRTESYLVSFFGRFNYTLMDQFLLTVTLRNDQTSRFSPETRSGLFPSAAFAWKINQLGNLKNSQTLSQLKLRLGWGITGQQNIGQGDYPYLPLYTASEPTAQYILGNQYYITLRPEGYDKNIKWEETTTYNAGLDFGFSGDRHYGSIDVYYRQTKDLLNFIPVPAGTNLTNFILTNIGDLENRGIEFSFFTRPVVREKVTWEIGFNASYNENKITKLTATDDPDYLGVETGGISGGVGNNIQIHSVGYPTNSFFVWEQVYDANGNPIEGLYVDRNGDGEITNDDKYHFHKPAADFWFGLNSRVDFYNFQFSFSGRANFGNYVYNNISSNDGVWERLYRPEGPYLSNVSNYVYQTNFQSPEYLSDYYIQDASFFKMDYISLSYIFRSIGGSRVNLRISGTVNNAFTITNYEGLDPELSNGIDNNIYPRPRAYVLGVNLQF
jgi:TonB-linked SusC/RagA family outer membrane protein